MAYTEIDDPSAYFQTALYTGNGGTQSIVHNGNSDLQPDWVWCKVKSGDNHAIFDSVRGGQKQLRSNTNGAELSRSNAISSFNSDGFTMGGQPEMNSNGQTYVTWNWKKVAGVFDIQTYTGNGSNRTISHNLGTVPKMMIIKKRNTTAPWSVGHASLGANQVLELDATDAVATDNSYWNNTRPTSSVFSLGTDGNQNTNGHTYVIYLFGNKQGMSKMGSYKGNGNADGTFIYTGFKPSFILGKRTDSGGGWWILDSKRPGFNLTDEYLLANDGQAEADDGSFASDFLSNGWKARATNGNFNASGGSYIYMAFAENPFTTSTGVPATAR